MKVAIIFSEGIKQINFTPENDDEKQALNLIYPNDNIELAVKTGSFGESNLIPSRHGIAMCGGGYLRKFPDSESIMLVLSPKKEEVKKEVSKVIDPKSFKDPAISGYSVYMDPPRENRTQYNVVIENLTHPEAKSWYDYISKV